MADYELTMEQKQLLQGLPDNRVKSIIRRLLEELDTTNFVGTHTHGNITNAGLIGSTANLPVVTTTGGAVTVGAYGTAATQPAAGNHVHGGISNTGAIGTEASKVIVTGASGVLEAKSLGGTGATDIPAGSHTHAYSADSHAHGDVTNDGKVGTTANYVVMTTTGGAVTAKNFGTGATDPAAGNHTHSYSADTHAHGNITNAGKVGAAANIPLITGTDGIVQAGAFGTNANEFAEGDHTHTQMTNTTTPVEARAAEYRTVDATANAEMHFTAKTLGTAGEAVTVTFVAPQAPYPDTLEVTVPQDSDIVVQLAGTAAVAAVSVLTIANGQNAGENETVTIGDMVYRFKADPTGQVNDVDIGADASASCQNLTHAINNEGTPGTHYHASTPENTYVSAVTGVEIVTITAKTAGIGGNSIALAEAMAQGSWDDNSGHMEGGTDATATITTIASAVKTAIEALPAAHALVSVAYRGASSGAGIVEAETETALAGGINGTAGNDGQYLVSENGVSISLGASTTGDSNWKLLEFSGPDNKFTREHFEVHPVCTCKTGEAAQGATGDENMMLFERNMFEYHILGAGQTIKQPQLVATGLDIELDETDDEGVEVSQGILARNRGVFTVGTDGAFYFKCKFSLEDVSDTDDCAVGFRETDAYNAALDDYTDLACLNVISGNINSETILANAGTLTTDTLLDFVDGETRTFECHVSATGVTTFKIDGETPGTVGAYTFADGTVVTPFFFFLHCGDGSCAPILQEWEVGLE